MKKLLLFFSVFLSISFSFAQTYYLNVNLKDGTKATYSISDVSKINFTGVADPNAIKQLSHIVKAFKLLQNYPNPFNPSTTIQYEIPTKGHVIITIYDINGKLINTILNAEQQAGEHQVIWKGKTKEGKKAASGFYIYNVKYKNMLLSKKMILLK